MEENEEKLNEQNTDGQSLAQGGENAENEALTQAETPAGEPAENAVSDGQPAGGESINAAVTEAADGSEAEDLLGKKKLSEEEALKQLEGRTIEAPKKKKFGWVGKVLLLGVIALGIWFIFKDVSDNMEGESAGSFVDVVRGGNWVFAIITLVVLLAILFCDWFKYAVIMKTTTGKFNLRTSMKVAFLGKYYDNVTPFAAGGQPMQIYYLHKKGFSGGVSSAVVLIKYFAHMFSMTFVGLLLMACNTGILAGVGDATWSTLIFVAGWIGLAINMALPLGIILFALLPKFSQKMAGFVVGIGAKIKIVKDKERAMAKALGVVKDFRSAFAIMSHKPLNFIILVVLCLVDVSLSFAFPYFILRMFSAIDGSGGILVLLQIMALNVYAIHSVAVIPTPGNSGAIEVVVMKAFSALTASAVLTWSVLTWRLVVYYIYIVIGIILTVYEFIRSIYRRNKAKKLAKLNGEQK